MEKEIETQLIQLEAKLRNAATVDEKTKIGDLLTTQGIREHFDMKHAVNTHEMEQRFPSLWTFYKTLAEDGNRRGAQNESGSEVRQLFSIEWEHGDDAQQQIDKKPMPNSVELPRDFEFDYYGPIPDELNVGYDFRSHAEVTQYLRHASACVNKDCEVIRCARLKMSIQHLATCSQRPAGCVKCYLFFRLVSGHCSNCESENCEVKFCHSIRAGMHEATERLQAQKTKKVRVGRRFYKTTSENLVPCGCCVFKTMDLKP